MILRTFFIILGLHILSLKLGEIVYFNTDSVCFRSVSETGTRLLVEYSRLIQLTF